jgi:hypothetical protein
MRHNLNARRLRRLLNPKRRHRAVIVAKVKFDLRPVGEVALLLFECRLYLPARLHISLRYHCFLNWVGQKIYSKALVFDLVVLSSERISDDDDPREFENLETLADFFASWAKAVHFRLGMSASWGVAWVATGDSELAAMIQEKHSHAVSSQSSLKVVRLIDLGVRGHVGQKFS